MCIIITVLLSPKRCSSKFMEVLKGHNREVGEVNNDCNKAIKENELFWYATRNMCDCGTQLGSLNLIETSRISLKEMERLKKKGWSNSKMERYKRDKERINKRNSRVKELQNESILKVGANPDGWVSILNDLFDIDRDVKVGIIKHWFSDQLNPEILRPKNRVKLKFDESISLELLKIEEDKCYLIENSKPSLN